jgi:hypothetical protein
MKSSLVKVGTEFEANQGGNCVVLEFINYKKVIVEFIGYEGKTYIKNIAELRNGKFRNPFKPVIFGVGFSGLGVFNSSCRVYSRWTGMMKRCYSKDFQDKHPSYVGCSVHPDWHNFQVFAKWYVEHEFYEYNYQIDKDILFKGNKVYSAKTCCLVPVELNSLIATITQKVGELPVGVTKTKFNTYNASVKISGKNKSLGTYKNVDEALSAYKGAKEKHIYQTVVKWKGMIEHKAYRELVMWSI